MACNNIVKMSKLPKAIYSFNQPLSKFHCRLSQKSNEQFKSLLEFTKDST